jgi:hypothetical protein
MARNYILTEQRSRSGSVEEAELSICRGLDYGQVAAGREGSALTPAHLSPPPQSHTHTEREGESTGGVAAGQGDTG